MKKILNLMTLIAVFFAMTTQSMAQSSREYIRTAIRERGECRNVALTKTGGDLMLNGRNGYAYKSILTGLANKIKELHDRDVYIDDVQLTENGSWIVLWGDNGVAWNDIPYSLEKKIREYNEDGEVINTITFNDDGDWIIITNTKYAASSSVYLDWLSEGEKTHGELWTAHITDDAIVAVYENGFKYGGEYPSTLRERAREADFDVYRLKFAGSAWFIADKRGNYDYHM